MFNGLPNEKKSSGGNKEEDLNEADGSDDGSTGSDTTVVDGGKKEEDSNDDDSSDGSTDSNDTVVQGNGTETGSNIATTTNLVHASPMFIIGTSFKPFKPASVNESTKLSRSAVTGRRRRRWRGGRRRIIKAKRPSNMNIVSLPAIPEDMAVGARMCDHAPAENAKDQVQSAPAMAPCTEKSFEELRLEHYERKETKAPAKQPAAEFGMKSDSSAGFFGAAAKAPAFSALAKAPASSPTLFGTSSRGLFAFRPSASRPSAFGSSVSDAVSGSLPATHASGFGTSSQFSFKTPVVAPTCDNDPARNKAFSFGGISTATGLFGAPAAASFAKVPAAKAPAFSALAKAPASALSLFGSPGTFVFTSSASTAFGSSASDSVSGSLPTTRFSGFGKSSQFSFKTPTIAPTCDNDPAKNQAFSFGGTATASGLFGAPAKATSFAALAQRGNVSEPFGSGAPAPGPFIFGSAPRSYEFVARAPNEASCYEVAEKAEEGDGNQRAGMDNREIKALEDRLKVAKMFKEFAETKFLSSNKPIGGIADLENVAKDAFIKASHEVQDAEVCLKAALKKLGLYVDDDKDGLTESKKKRAITPVVDTGVSPFKKARN